MQNLAKAISWIFNPLLMPIYALIIVMYVPSDHFFYNPYCMYRLPEYNKLLILYRFFLLCAAVPAMFFFILKRYGFINSIEMDERKERAIPIIIMFAFSLLLYISTVLGTQHSSFLPKYIYALPLSGVLITFVFYFLNKWKKISIHAAAAGILVGFVFAFILDHEEFHLWVLALSFVISGIVLSSRLYLEKHTLQETIIGWGIGSFITFGVNYFYFY